MRHFKKKTLFLIASITVLWMMGCANPEPRKKENQQESPKVIAKNQIDMQKKDQLIDDLFQEITSEIISWMQEENPSDKESDGLDLKEKDITLYKDILKDRQLIAYTTEFIRFREEIKNSQQQENFDIGAAIKKFQNSDIYQNVIFRENSKPDNVNAASLQVYLDKRRTKKAKIDRTLDRFVKNYRSVGKSSLGGFLSGFILFLSIVLNAVLVFFHRKRSQQDREKIDALETELREEKQRNQEREEERNREKGEESKSRKSVQLNITEKPKELERSDIEKHISREFESLRSKLNSTYHPVCIEKVDSDISIMESSTKEHFFNQGFEKIDELDRVLHNQMNSFEVELSGQLNNCIHRNEAILTIKEKIGVQNFIDVVNKELITREEILNKIDQFREIAIEALPTTLHPNELTHIIDELDNKIGDSLHDLAQERLICYFPFTDEKGRLNDSKKEIVKGRDTALELSLNPDNLNRATFTLLYDNDEMMEAGILSYDVLLLPICEISREYFNSAGTKIEQIGEDGTMVLENGFWQVERKISIKVL